MSKKGLYSGYEKQPSLGDMFGVQALPPLPNIVQDDTIRNGGTAFYERFNSRLAPAVENKLMPTVERRPSSVKPNETGSIAGLFAGVSPFEMGQSPKSTPSPEGARGDSTRGKPGDDDDMKFLYDMLEKKFGYEKRGASIRQGMANAAQGNTQLHSISNALMGLG